MDQWPVAPDKIGYLFLSHAHIDHIGRVPELIEKEVQGRDHLFPSHQGALGAHAGRCDGVFGESRAQSSDGIIEEAIDDLSWGFEYGETFDLTNGVSFKLKRAGHILGSSFIRVFRTTKTGWSVLFSGDLGAGDTPILVDPEPPDSADLVVMESTYGDRRHADRKRRIEQLGAVLSRALADRGKVFIPAFSLGRTQELVYEMDRIFTDPRCREVFPELQVRQRPPVFVDSPLGLKITRIYARLAEYWDSEARDLEQRGDHPIDFHGLYAVENHRDHLKLCQSNGPAIILAGSGMCTGGRIIDHLQNGIEQPENDILFVGYQAACTPGRDIQTYADKPNGYVVLDGERKTIAARVHSLTGYSAHADQKGLVDWIAAMPEKPGAVKLVHGENGARQALKEVLERRGYKVQ